MMRAVFYILFIFIFSPSKGQEIKVTSAFDTTRIFAGDQINFTITIDKPANVNVILPFFHDTLNKNIEILSGPIIDSTFSGDGRVRIIERYLVTSFDSGFYQIKPVFAEVKSPDGLKRFYSDFALLEVMKYKIAPADTTAMIYDIIGPYRAPITLGEILPWALIAIFVALFALGLIKYLKSGRKVKPEFVEVSNPDPAHVIAFRELEKLRDEELWQKGHVKQYYTRLTEILRQYLENRYRVYSLELTTSETLDALLRTGFRKDQPYEQLRTVLSSADLVKFAKFKPDNSENVDHFRNAWEFVQATKVVEVITEKQSTGRSEVGLNESTDKLEEERQ